MRVELGNTSQEVTLRGSIDEMRQIQHLVRLGTDSVTHIRNQGESMGLSPTGAQIDAIDRLIRNGQAIASVSNAGTVNLV